MMNDSADLMNVFCGFSPGSVNVRHSLGTRVGTNAKKENQPKLKQYDEKKHTYVKKGTENLHMIYKISMASNADTSRL